MSESVCYLNEARNGDIDAAFHGLIELSDDPILALQEAYRAKTDPAIRRRLWRAVSQHHLPATIDFLAIALEDPHPEALRESMTKSSCSRGSWPIRTGTSSETSITSIVQVRP